MRSLLSGGLRRGLGGGRLCGGSRSLGVVAGAVPGVVVAGVVGPGPGSGGLVVADREAGDLVDEVGAGGEFAAAQQALVSTENHSSAMSSQDACFGV